MGAPLAASGVLRPAAALLRFLSQHFELGNGLEVTGAPRRSFRANEPFEIEARRAVTKQGDGDGVREEIGVPAPTGDLAEQIEVPRTGREGEVEPRAQRLD